MLEYISTKSSHLFFPNLGDEEDETYIYGFCLLYSTCFIILSILIISSLLGNVLHGVTFCITFISIRRYCGGYHAKTYSDCFIKSNLCFIVVYFFSIFAFSCLNVLLLNLSTLLTGIGIYYQTNNSNRKKIKLVLFLYFTCVFFVTMLHPNTVINIVPATLLSIYLLNQFYPKRKEVS